MEISNEVIASLNLLNDKVDEGSTKKLLISAVKQLSIDKKPPLPARSTINDSYEGFEVKQAESAVLSLLLIAKKYGTDIETFRNFLETHKIKTVTVDQLVNCYEKLLKENISILLSKLGNNQVPNITSVSVEVQQLIPKNEVIFKLNLMSFDHSEGKSKVFQHFYLNQEELQSLINKLKEIERHCEKITK